MFLISNETMVVEATRAGITGAIPALNYRSDREFRLALESLNEKCSGPYGINLIANKSNFRLPEQLKACLDYQVRYIITSLGNPQHIIEHCHERGMLVFCDVVDTAYGSKVAVMKPDGLIAVNKNAGGHAGQLDSAELIASLKTVTELPIISAGGVGLGSQFYEKIQEGACGISMGSPFIASVESPVSEEYKQACIQYGSADVVMTTKLSGSPCTVINTPFVQQAGTRQNGLERFLNKSKYIKKIAKALTFYRGMRRLKKAAFSQTYQNVWCAGPSIEFVTDVLPIKMIVNKLVAEYHARLEINLPKG